MSILYYRTSETIATSIEALPVAQRIQFDATTSQIEQIQKSGLSNTVTEPEINPDGTKTIHKQQVGALNETLIISGNIDTSQTSEIAKLSLFARNPQIDDALQYGVIGFFDDDRIFSLDPTATVGYTMDPPTITRTSPQNKIDFIIKLSLGGKNLS
jgi:hypothetical protein